MKRAYYILNNGRLKRKDNTVCVESNGVRKYIPINDVESIYVFGELDFNTKALNFLAHNNVTVHLFNYYGFYTSSLYPREYLPSGFSLVNQVKKYVDKEERLKIAKEIISTASYNILKNLKYYNPRRNNKLEDLILHIEKEREKIPTITDIQDLMGTEGRIRDLYYSAFNIITKGKFKIKKRVKRPPDNPMNTLISFGNSLLYATVLTEIYHTQLNPTISFLHEPGERRFSLSLDISEVFKPIIVDRVIFKLINEGMIDESHFTEELNFCHLNEKGRKVFLKQFEEKLNTTIKHKDLGREISYKRLIRLECYKLIKHINDIKEYNGLKMWW
ncbi:type I-B CRISPR-associated endonuclease Cas1b [Caloranaerobacter azorensis]|uniref:CRISPR-associated endonuclease Cas1 n=1 Tax=Caloranaerobacter azorensis TaxID=116090 RepID=A0A6P1YGG9_9FIRM|nr:type I-B CRISPR-associated endonuclease Cas1b [Caloranaerobacter azorensis]QIB27295.1 type I-B CRISPR-associated endonuclease Cas1 [Caloranaerobacter azorensis]